MSCICAAKKLKKFKRFVSKGGMDIDGISEATLARFINEGWIRNIGDIYRLPEHKEEIAQLDGFGEKSADNIMASLGTKEVDIFFVVNYLKTNSKTSR